MPKGFFGFSVKACSTRVQDRHGGFVRDILSAHHLRSGGWSKAKSALETASDVSGWWLHDLHRTLATRVERLGLRLEVTEAVLNHLSGSRAGVVGIYQARLGRGETRCTRRMLCAPSRRSGRQADCGKGVAIQPSALRRDVGEGSTRRSRRPGGN